jgi:hypothetical protein
MADCPPETFGIHYRVDIKIEGVIRSSNSQRYLSCINNFLLVSKILWIILILSASTSFAQSKPKKRDRFPSYFGIQVRPVFPSSYVGEPNLTLTNAEFSTTVSQKLGYSFGGTVRAGLTKLLAFETGINFTQRQYVVSMSVADSNVYARNDLSFISYDVPINALVYVQLSKKIYMNASLGAALTFKPTSVGILTLPGGKYSITHTGVVDNKGAIDFNANVGFEFRTEKRGFFYLGGSIRIPFHPLFYLVAEYKYEGYRNTLYGIMDGTFMAIDLKYFFPNIQTKGLQFQDGPIE